MDAAAGWVDGWMRREEDAMVRERSCASQRQWRVRLAVTS